MMRNGELNDYYKTRHDYLTNVGWLVLEIPYAWCYKLDKINEICHAIDNRVDVSLEEHKLLCESKRKTSDELKQLYKIRHDRAELTGQIKSNGSIDYRMISKEEWQHRHDILINSGVDITKFGWVTKMINATGFTKRVIERNCCAL